MDPDLARIIGRNARKHVESQFSHQVHFERLMQIYAEAIEQAGSVRLRALAP